MAKRKAKPYKAKKKKAVTANEPVEKYGKTTLRIYHSWEEAEQGDLEDSLSLDPVMGLKYTIQLTLGAYGVTRETLRKIKMSNKVFFGNRE